jgi:integrase
VAHVTHPAKTVAHQATSRDPGEITAITAALNAGIPFRDVQDFTGHADPRTTRRYDRSRHNLDRHATYALASRLGRGTDQSVPPDEQPGP